MPCRIIVREEKICEKMIRPETIKSLSPEKKRAIMERSMEDVSSVYEETGRILKDIRENGDAVAAFDFLVVDRDLRHEASLN